MSKIPSPTMKIADSFSLVLTRVFLRFCLFVLFSPSPPSLSLSLSLPLSPSPSLPLRFFFLSQQVVQKKRSRRASERVSSLHVSCSPLSVRLSVFVDFLPFVFLVLCCLYSSNAHAGTHTPSFLPLSLRLWLMYTRIHTRSHARMHAQSRSHQYILAHVCASCLTRASHQLRWTTNDPVNQWNINWFIQSYANHPIMDPSDRFPFAAQLYT